MSAECQKRGKRRRRTGQPSNSARRGRRGHLGPSVEFLHLNLDAFFGGAFLFVGHLKGGG